MTGRGAYKVKDGIAPKRYKFKDGIATRYTFKGTLPVKPISARTVMLAARGTGRLAMYAGRKAYGAVKGFARKRGTRRVAGGAASFGGGALWAHGIMNILAARTTGRVVKGFAQSVAGSVLAHKGAGIWRGTLKGGPGSYGGRGAYTGRGRGWRKFAKGKKRG